MNAKMAREALVGVSYLVVIGLLVTLSVMVFRHDFTSYTTVSLRAGNIGDSLQQGSDVEVRGMVVGEVDSITPQGDGSMLRLRLDPSKVDTLPANMTARLLPKTLFGERYVNLLLPAAPSGATLQSGDVLEEDRSAQTVQLEKLFDDMQPVLQAVQPGKLSATLGAIAEALRGRGPDLAATLHTVGDYLTQLNPQVPQLLDDLAQLATVAQNYSTAAPEIIDGLNSLVTTSQTIVQQRQSLENLFTSVTAMSNVVGGFVNSNQGNIIGLSGTSRPTLQLLADFSGEFPCLARALQDYIPVGNAAFGAGSNQSGAHVILHVVPSSPKYTEADRPTFDTPGGPSCPYTPPTALAGTALSAVPGIQGANTATPTGTSFDNAAGMGPANSPAENELIAELMASSVGTTPAAFPKWGSLLLGPALRGAAVTVK